jgi:hypothetical protein
MWFGPAALLLAFFIATDPGPGVRTLISYLPLLLAVLVTPLLVTPFFASERNGLLGHRTYSIQRDGIQATTVISQVLIKWPQVASLDRTKRHFLIEVGPNCFWIIPRRVFNTSQEANAFYAEATSLWTSARADLKGQALS